MTEAETVELEGLRRCYHAARELIGEFDDTGEVSRKNLEVLRFLCWDAWDELQEARR